MKNKLLQCKVSKLQNRAVYFAGGPEEHESADADKDKNKDKGASNLPNNPADLNKDARDKGAKLVDAGMEKGEELKTPELKKNLTEDEAVAIYDGMIDPAKKNIDFFAGKEKDYDKNKKALDAAFIAVGGDAQMTKTSGEKAKPSNLLMDGLPGDSSDSRARLSQIYEDLNKVDSSNHINALMKISNYSNWNKFADGLKTLDTRSKAGKKAFDSAKG